MKFAIIFNEEAPLTIAVANENIEIIKLLLENEKIDVNIRQILKIQFYFVLKLQMFLKLPIFIFNYIFKLFFYFILN